MNISEMAARRPNRFAALKSIAYASRKMWRADGEDLFVDVIGGLGCRDSQGRQVYPLQIEAALMAHPRAARVFCTIESPGGRVAVADKICELLRMHDGYLTTVAQGVCASAAVDVLIEGEFRAARDGAQILIHAPDIHPDDKVRWTAGRHSAAAKALTEHTDRFVEKYAQKTGRDAAMFRKEIANENFLTINQAKRLGIVHAVEGEERWHDGRAYFFEGITMRARQHSLRAHAASAVMAMARARQPVPVVGL